MIIKETTMSKYKLYFRKYYLDYTHGYKIHVFAIIITLLIAPNHLFCTNTFQVDSLLKVLNNCKEDSSRIGIYKELGNHYKRQSPDTSSVYFKEALKLSEKNNWEDKIAYFKMELGENCLELGNMVQSEKLLNSALIIYTKLDNNKGRAKVLGFQGNVYWKQGDFQKSTALFLEALQIAEKLGDKKQIAQMCNDIGIIYWERGNNDKSLEYYLRSYEIRKELDDKRGITQSLKAIF